MGKKPKNKQDVSDKYELPFISVCTPTFNRRPFWSMCIENFKNQDYPMDKMEWIIIDDGTDLIEDLVKDIPQVNYFKYDTKMPLGKKRNLMHEKSKGDIIIYMDDDDYYPPQRVSHAVNMLLSHPTAMCAGASEIYIWFKHIQKMWQFGPYSENHATAGTFAFKRELLKTHRYEDTASLAEEKAFLKNYTVPFVQLEPKKTILVFSHIQNTFDKKRLIQQGASDYQRECSRTVDEFVKEPDKREFYMNTIDELLKNYEPGDPKNKPDVLKQIEEIDKERRMLMSENAKNQSDNKGKIFITQNNGKTSELNNEQIVQIIRKQQEELQELAKVILEKDNEITILKKNYIGIENNKDKSKNKDEDLKYSILNIDSKIDMLARVCERIYNEQRNE